MESGTPFDLNTAVAAWRRRLLTHPGIWPSDIDELEAHLWDEIDSRISKGASEKVAFRTTTERLGEPDALAREFVRSRRTEIAGLTDAGGRAALAPFLLVHYVKVARRTLTRGLGYAAISVSGLAVGICCFLLIAVHLLDEFSVDGFHENGSRIFRIATDVTFRGQEERNATSPQRLAPQLSQSFPGVEEVVRVDDSFSNVVGNGDNLFVEERRLATAGASFFRIFSFPLSVGDPRTALEEPFSVVISPNAALKYFGDVSPLGLALQIDHRDYTVTGVLGRPLGRSHLDFDFIVSRSTRRALHGPVVEEIEQNWRAGTHTYVLLDSNTDPGVFQRALTDYVGSQLSDPELALKFSLQPLPEIYLRSDRRYEFATGDRRQLSLLAALAAIILIVACINFVNLATSRAGRRLKEVGVRKVLGASRSQLARQFLFETSATCTVAVLIALVVAYIALPAFGALIGTTLNAGMLWDSRVLVAVVAVTLVVTLLSGAYPAFQMSRPTAAGGIRGAISFQNHSISRTGLAVIQFTISITLITCAIVVAAQLRFLGQPPAGYDADQVVVLRWRDLEGFPARYAQFKERLEASAGIESVAASTTYGVLGAQEPDERDENATLEAEWIGVDYDFIETLDLHVIAGRSFSEEIAGDARNAFVINESAAAELGVDDPIGLPISLNGRTGTVIGVVEDFHTASLREPLAPTVLQIMSIRSMPFVSVRLDGRRVSDTLSLLESTWKEFAPGWPFEFSFLDRRIDDLYSPDHRLGTVFKVSSAIAMILACLGLFALAALQVERRRKEIGIRKVHGATTGRIVGLLSRNALLPVLASAIVSIPIAYYVMNTWLQTFAYRIALLPHFFILSGIGACIVAAAAVGSQTFRAARAAPVQSLRYE